MMALVDTGYRHTESTITNITNITICLCFWFQL